MKLLRNEKGKGAKTLQEISTKRRLSHVGLGSVLHRQGRRHNFESGGYKYYCERSEQKIFWVVPPTYTILGVQQLQREAHGQPIGQRCYNILLVVFVQF